MILIIHVPERSVERITTITKHFLDTSVPTEHHAFEIVRRDVIELCLDLGIRQLEKRHKIVPPEASL